MATEVLLYLVIVLLIMQVVFIGIVINLQMKHKRMQAKYQIFMRGKDGKSLEKGFLEQFKTVEKLERAHTGFHLILLYRLGQSVLQDPDLVSLVRSVRYYLL